MEQKVKKNWPDIAMVGYIDTSAIGAVAKINEQQVKNYNVIIFGFTLDGTVSDTLIETFNKIKQWQEPNTLNLLSLGGAGGNLVLDDNLINNLIASLKEYEFDGVDLDIEDSGISIDTLASFVSRLKQKINNEYLLTIAPILAGKPSAPTLNIPGGDINLEPIYSQTKFDAILVQAYNSGTSFVYPKPGEPANLVSEASADIISAAYNSLQKSQTIDADSKIVIGIPANAGGAPTASNLWDIKNLDQLPEVTAAIKQNLQDIVEGMNQIHPEQFGGVMAWSLNTDAFPGAYPAFNGYVNAPTGYFADQVASFVLSLAPKR